MNIRAFFANKKLKKYIFFFIEQRQQFIHTYCTEMSDVNASANAVGAGAEVVVGATSSSRTFSVSFHWCISNSALVLLYCLFIVLLFFCETLRMLAADRHAFDFP